MELCAEPFHLSATRNGALAVRLVAETASTCCKAGVTAWLLLAPPPRWRALPVELCFAAAQGAGAVALLAAYVAGAAAQPRAVWPGAPRAPDRQILLLLRDFSAQAVWKLALAEGDKAALLTQGAPVATGVYGLATNLGGLAARLVLQPLEEAAFCAFAAGSTSAGRRRAHDALHILLRVLLLVRAHRASIVARPNAQRERVHPNELGARRRGCFVRASALLMRSSFCASCTAHTGPRRPTRSQRWAHSRCFFRFWR